MAIADNMEAKRSCSDVFSATNEDGGEVQRPEDNSNLNVEGNPLLEPDRKFTSVIIDASVAKLKRTDKDEDDHASMNNLRKDTETDERNVVTPPDGGLRAWMIMIGSFVINGVLFSVINSYSLIYLELQKRLLESGDSSASAKAALVGSLTIGTTFFLSPISGILTDKIGIQMTTFLGGALASSGMLLSSIFSSEVALLYLTYGVMYGLGASLAYTPSLAILGHYFKRYLGLVNGIVTTGSSIFTTLMPYFMEVLLRRFGLDITLRCLAVLTAVIMACAVLFKPIPLNSDPRDQLKSKTNFQSCLKEVVNVSIWRKKRYVVWASSIPLALFGYFVPYVHIGKFVQKVFQGDEKLPIMCIGITSGIGRLVFGYIADLPRVNRILLQQISFVSIGILTMLLPITPSFTVLLVISLAMGLFDGCFISLLGPIAFDICGREGATQAIGFLLGMCSIPLTVGPPIAGILYDLTGSYDLPFFLAGIPPIVGGLTMFLIKFVKDEDHDSVRENSENKAACQNGCSSIDFLPQCFVATLKHMCDSQEQPSWQTMRRNVCNHRQRCCGFREVNVCEVHGTKCLDRHRYSESVPLLYDESQSLRLNGDFQRTAKSSMLLTF
ncbi:monocarboxylate transporter 10 isoform X1 [Hylaeus volcanicus]|uniref:monocarboxylate transporter 10 isoform X1 n=1 Tax=Hylaeus volcanicus TaxID=313075 RepID=UPI0023B800BC|nr:monocarboxylate transporter 10 isoform X1 [Hylaeus volcanicus]XP_053981939.1 monocarboxylate transporter 10 isoform X1 [Hylaeus volcanicus]XP_053981940.1 monocarboxylate transporter 10 isoform X1 [Hylaeus volcanicus]XP_053981941.1 monocarboxylate transporter 10 isoform X1 [Hylaeus volcanicus]XP_053981942.1 monocarboxylate transporter 10 isoform X1 [Hylaeus volcanicus]XP_053981943.1 monocarboxylate transporter 10 isoform X1 [Hylaeus volcanicus]XP_053981944.1 monocarboxylate transporter 10 i